MEAMEEIDPLTAVVKALKPLESVGAGKCPKFCVSDFRSVLFPFLVLLLQRAEEAKRSPNWMANWPMAAVHSMGLRQCTPAFLMAR